MGRERVSWVLTFLLALLLAFAFVALPRALAGEPTQEQKIQQNELSQQDESAVAVQSGDESKEPGHADGPEGIMADSDDLEASEVPAKPEATEEMVTEPLGESSAIASSQQEGEGVEAQDEDQAQPAEQDEETMAQDEDLAEEAQEALAADAAGDASWKRLDGKTALDTMQSILRVGWENNSCNTVIVATIDSFYDSLSASGLAGVYRCPILQTNPSSLSKQTRAEIKRLGATRVIIAGGPKAVLPRVESQLRSMGLQVERVWGQNAVGTSIAIWQHGLGYWGSDAIIATSVTYQDALSISPYAYAKKAPVILTDFATCALTQEGMEAVTRANRAIICGGPAAVSTDVDDYQLRGMNVVRLWGQTAIETSARIAQWCTGQGLSANNVGVATADGYYDALSASAFCGKLNSVLVLVANKDSATIRDFVSPWYRSISVGWVFGGKVAIADLTYRQLETVTSRAYQTTRPKHRYEVVNESLSWTEAEAAARARGGHLVTINNAAEQNLVAALLDNQSRSFYWIGLTRANASRTFVWSYGQSDYRAWAEGEPNDTMHEPGGENYVGMWCSSHSREKGLWNDFINNGRRTDGSCGYIVEYE